MRCCAVRAKGSGGIIEGEYGLFRPDVAEVISGNSEAIFSGFRFELIQSIQESLFLEWLDESGCWWQFWRSELEQTGGAVYDLSLIHI